MYFINKSTVTTYKVISNYYLDVIQEDSNYYEAWLYNNAYGVKSFLFGCKSDDVQNFLAMCEVDILNYIIEYKKQYEDDFSVHDLLTEEAPR